MRSRLTDRKAAWQSRTIAAASAASTVRAASVQAADTTALVNVTGGSPSTVADLKQQLQDLTTRLNNAAIP